MRPGLRLWIMLLFVLGGFLLMGVVLGISAAPARRQAAPPTVTPTQSRTPGPPRTVRPQQAWPCTPLVFPLAERMPYSSLFDHTTPLVAGADGNITIYSGAAVSDDPNDDNDNFCQAYRTPTAGGPTLEPSQTPTATPRVWVCEYTDYDTGLVNLRWHNFRAGWLAYDRHNGYDIPPPRHTPDPLLPTSTPLPAGTPSPTPTPVPVLSAMEGIFEVNSANCGGAEVRD